MTAKQKLIAYIEGVDDLQARQIRRLLINDAREKLAREEEIQQAYQQTIINSNYVLWQYRNLLDGLEEGE